MRHRVPSGFKRTLPIVQEAGWAPGPFWKLQVCHRTFFIGSDKYSHVQFTHLTSMLWQDTTWSARVTLQWDALACSHPWHFSDGNTMYSNYGTSFVLPHNCIHIAAWNAVLRICYFVSVRNLLLIYSVIQKDGLNFVRLYFLNYTWYNLMFFWPCIMNWLYINYQLDALIIIYS